MNVDFQQLKAGGIIRQKQKDFFSIRLKIPLGNLQSEQLIGIAKISEKYGKGRIHLTMRQGIEIPYVRIDDIERVINSLKEIGLILGACGARVRVITACQGDSLCPHGLGNTQELALKLDELYYGRSGLPHKFKIGVTGCPNSCIKPQENDVGFMAVAEPILDESNDNLCTGCGLCVSVCPAGAIKLAENIPYPAPTLKQQKNKDRMAKPLFNLSKCYKDAKCVFSCPANALKTGRSGWNVFLGGKWGKEPQLGIKILEFLSTSEAVVLVGKILDAYIKLAKKGERVGSVINRIGMEKFKENVL